MASQFQLFTQRNFVSMFATQFLGAFNDNIFKNSLILILTYTATAKLGLSIGILTNLAAMLFILPYFLFSALAGQIADHFEKSWLTQQIKLLEIIIMLAATLGFIFEWYWFLFTALFLMGMHSAFFGPIKYAYLPQMMNKEDLVSANGLFQMGTSLAILIGMITAGILTQLTHAHYWISGICLMVATSGYLASRFIPKVRTLSPDNDNHANNHNNINYNIISISLKTIKYLYSLPLLFFVILGNSWFWFYGATFLTQTPEFSKTILHGNESVVIFLSTLFSVGIALGSVLCKRLSKNIINLKLLPFGIIGLSLFAIDLYFMLKAFANYPITNTQDFFGINQLLQINSSIRVFFDLFCIGFFGGIYIVPLYAFMQAYSPKNRRAIIIGANNIFNAIFMVISAIFAMIVLKYTNITVLFLITAVINAIFGFFIYRKLKFYQHSMTQKV